MTYEQLNSVTTSWKDFIRARKLCEFEDWLVDTTKSKNKHEVVEYFE